MFGSPDGAEIDRVGRPQPGQPVGRHELAMLAVPVRTPVVVIDREFELAVLGGDRFQHFQAGGDDLGADAVGGDGGDAVRAHGYSAGAEIAPTGDSSSRKRASGGPVGGLDAADHRRIDAGSAQQRGDAGGGACSRRARPASRPPEVCGSTRSGSAGSSGRARQHGAVVGGQRALDALRRQFARAGQRGQRGGVDGGGDAGGAQHLAQMPGRGRSR